MKMKKKGYAMGGMKKGYAMGGMKKKMKAGGGVKKMEAGGPTQEQINDPARAVDAGNRMSKMREAEAAMGKKKPMRPKKRPTAPLKSNAQCHAQLQCLLNQICQWVALLNQWAVCHRHNSHQWAALLKCQ